MNNSFDSTILEAQKIKLQRGNPCVILENKTVSETKKQRSKILKSKVTSNPDYLSRVFDGVFNPIKYLYYDPDTNRDNICSLVTADYIMNIGNGFFGYTASQKAKGAPLQTMTSGKNTASAYLCITYTHNQQKINEDIELGKAIKFKNEHPYSKEMMARNFVTVIASNILIYLEKHETLYKGDAISYEKGVNESIANVYFVCQLLKDLIMIRSPYVTQDALDIHRYEHDEVIYCASDGIFHQLPEGVFYRQCVLITEIIKEVQDVFVASIFQGDTVSFIDIHAAFVDESSNYNLSKMWKEYWDSIQKYELTTVNVKSPVQFFLINDVKNDNGQ